MFSLSGPLSVCACAAAGPALLGAPAHRGPLRHPPSDPRPADGGFFFRPRRQLVKVRVCRFVV